MATPTSTLPTRSRAAKRPPWIWRSPLGSGRFLIHLDVDVLNDDLMPAVDYRMPGGLSFQELTEVLSVAIASGGVAGIEITIFNPLLDPTGRAAAGLVEAVVQGLLGEG